MAFPHDPGTAMETESTVSEPSAAIVSVYNSWSTTSESIHVDDDALLLEDNHHHYGSLPETEPINTEELLKELKKRCPHEDIPHNLELRRRRRPVCQFRNFIGTRQYATPNVRLTAAYAPPPLMVFELPFGSHGLDLGLEEKDELFPLCSSKVKHPSDDDDGPEAKKARVDDRLTDGNGDLSEVNGRQPVAVTVKKLRDQLMGGA